MANEPTSNEIFRAKQSAVGGRKDRCVKGKSCSAACIALGLFCRVELPEPIAKGLNNVTNLLRSRKRDSSKEQVSGETNVKVLENKFSQGVVRFRYLIGKLKAKVKGSAPTFEPKVQRTRAPEPMTIDKRGPKKERIEKQDALQKAKRILDMLAKASSHKQTLFSGSSNPDEVKWSAVEGSGSKLLGSGVFGSFFSVPTNKLLGRAGESPERVGVKVGRLGQSEAFIVKKLGQAGIGPKLIAAKIINKAVSNSDNGTVHNGVLAMEIVPGAPLYKLRGKTVNGIDTTDAYWKARSELHKLGISHNDAHGGNVIIDDKGKARFVDLGLARRGWRSALAEAIGGHTGADFMVDSLPRWEMSKVFSRNYSRVKEILRENKFSDSDIKEMGDFGTQRTDREIKESPFGRISVPLAKQLIKELYRDI